MKLIAEVGIKNDAAKKYAKNKMSNFGVKNVLLERSLSELTENVIFYAIYNVEFSIILHFRIFFAFHYTLYIIYYCINSDQDLPNDTFSS